MFILIDQKYYLCFPVYYQDVEIQEVSVNTVGSPRVDSFQALTAVKKKKKGDQT